MVAVKKAAVRAIGKPRRTSAKATKVLKSKTEAKVSERKAVASNMSQSKVSQSPAVESTRAKPIKANDESFIKTPSRIAAISIVVVLDLVPIMGI
jgi:hypothetical protein